jgi:hypothetical protein
MSTKILHTSRKKNPKSISAPKGEGLGAKKLQSPQAPRAFTIFPRLLIPPVWTENKKTLDFTAADYVLHKKQTGQ